MIRFCEWNPAQILEATDFIRIQGSRIECVAVKSASLATIAHGLAKPVFLICLHFGSCESGTYVPNTRIPNFVTKPGFKMQNRC
jgi:hypothetical protein